MGVFVTNDTVHGWTGEVRWSLETLAGKRLKSGTEKAAVKALAAAAVCSLDFHRQVNDDNRRGLIFVAELWKGKEMVARQVAPFAPNKHLELAAPQIGMKVSASKNLLGFELSAKSLARFVELELEGADMVFSDNYFDLPAGQTQTITCPLPEGWTLEQAKAALRVRSLVDSY
jgi:beta-mannosidase